VQQKRDKVVKEEATLEGFVHADHSLGCIFNNSVNPPEKETKREEAEGGGGGGGRAIGRKKQQSLDSTTTHALVNKQFNQK
jgi:hypothetical protein